MCIGDRDALKRSQLAGGWFMQENSLIQLHLHDPMVMIRAEAAVKTAGQFTDL